MNDIQYGNIKENTRRDTSLTNSNTTTDYFSIINMFQTMLYKRQIEFQDSIIKALKINSPSIKLLIVLIIMHPKKALAHAKNNVYRFIAFIVYIHRLTTSIVKRKPTPKKISLEIPYLHENNINHMYIYDICRYRERSYIYIYMSL